MHEEYEKLSEFDSTKLEDFEPKYDW
jgi:hypothetical protein